MKLKADALALSASTNANNRAVEDAMSNASSRLNSRMHSRSNSGFHSEDHSMTDSADGGDLLGVEDYPAEQPPPHNGRRDSNQLNSGFISETNSAARSRAQSKDSNVTLNSNSTSVLQATVTSSVLNSQSDLQSMSSIRGTNTSANIYSHDSDMHNRSSVDSRPTTAILESDAYLARIGATNVRNDPAKLTVGIAAPLSEDQPINYTDTITNTNTTSSELNLRDDSYVVTNHVTLADAKLATPLHSNNSHGKPQHQQSGLNIALPSTSNTKAEAINHETEQELLQLSAKTDQSNPVADSRKNAIPTSTNSRVKQRQPIQQQQSNQLPQQQHAPPPTQIAIPVETFPVFITPSQSLRSALTNPSFSASTNDRLPLTRNDNNIDDLEAELERELRQYMKDTENKTTRSSGTTGIPANVLQPLTSSSAKFGSQYQEIPGISASSTSISGRNRRKKAGIMSKTLPPLMIQVSNPNVINNTVVLDQSHSEKRPVVSHSTSNLALGSKLSSQPKRHLQSLESLKTTNLGTSAIAELMVSSVEVDNRGKKVKKKN